MTICNRLNESMRQSSERSALQINKMDGMTAELRTTINNTVHRIAVAKWKPLNLLKNPQRLLSSSTRCFITWSINWGEKRGRWSKNQEWRLKWGWRDGGVDVNKSSGVLEKRWEEEKRPVWVSVCEFNADFWEIWSTPTKVYNMQAHCIS